MKSHLNLKEINECAAQVGQPHSVNSTHIVIGVLNRSGEAVNDTTSTTKSFPAILTESFLTQDLNDITVRSTRMKEQREVVFLR